MPLLHINYALIAFDKENHAFSPLLLPSDEKERMKIHIHLNHHQHHHHNHESSGEKKRMLINFTVMGSAGPIRLIGDENLSVDSVISRALKTYARDGRLPALGSDDKNFLLYCPAFDDDLSPSENIVSLGCRVFTLHKKKKPEEETGLLEKKSGDDGVEENSRQHLKAWFKKSPHPDAPRSGHSKIKHYLAQPIIPILIPALKKPQVKEETRKDGGGDGKHSMWNSGNLKAWSYNSHRIAPYPFFIRERFWWKIHTDRHNDCSVGKQPMKK